MDELLRGRKSLAFFVLISLIFMFLGSTVQAREGYGPVGYGMGGAGVAGVDDHLAPSWNPANLSIRSGVQAGFHGDLKLETTRNFGEDIDSMIDIMDDFDGDDYGDDDYFGAVLEHSNEIKRLVEGDDAGLVDAGGGFNFSWDNWALGVNSRVEGTAFWDGDGQSLFRIAVGDDADSEDMSELISSLGEESDTDLANVTWVDRPDGDYGTAADSIKNDIDEALDGDDICDIFYCSDEGAVTSDSVAYTIAARAEEVDEDKEDGYEGVTAANLETFSENFMGDIIGLASSLDGGDDQTLSTLSGGGTSNENGRIVAEGLMINEVTLSYAMEEPFYRTGYGDFYAGGNLKFMAGQVGANSCEFDEDDCEFDMDDHTEKSNDIGVDLGLRYHMPDYEVKVGLVGKNLNSPSFDYPDGDDYLSENRSSSVKIDPTFRLGTEIRPLYFLPTDAWGRDRWRLSMDYDLNTRDTIFEDYDRQNLALGTEFNLLNRPWFNIALRGGLRENLAESEAPTLYTAGLGLQMARFNFDLSAVRSRRSVEIDGDDWPTVLGVNLGLSLQF